VSTDLRHVFLVVALRSGGRHLGRWLSEYSIAVGIRFLSFQRWTAALELMRGGGEREREREREREESAETQQL